jgi:recombination protein RecA
MTEDETHMTKQEAIDVLSKEINAFYRKESKIPFDVLTPASSLQLEFVSTGSLALDRAMGGGFGLGRTVEFIGELSTLKSYFAQRGLANAQERGMRTAYYDPEGTFEPLRAEALGVDTDELQMVERALRGDQALDVVCSLLEQGNHFIVVDSVAAIIPKEEVEKRLGDDTVARQAALMSRAMRKITQANRSGVVVFTNQLRESIGVTFGPRAKPPGGKALSFYATHRIRFTRIETIKAPRDVYVDAKLKTIEKEVAWRIQAKVEKNKVGRPYGEAIFLFDLDEGMVNETEELMNLGLEYGLIQIDGSQHYIITETGERVRWRGGIWAAIQRDPAAFREPLQRLIRGGASSTPVVSPPAPKAPEAPAS